MPCHIGQGLLKNAIQTDLDRRRQGDGDPIAQSQIHSNIVDFGILGNVSAQRNTQTVVVENCWMKPAGEPANFVDGLRGDFSPRRMRSMIAGSSSSCPGGSSIEIGLPIASSAV